MVLISPIFHQHFGLWDQLLYVLSPLIFYSFLIWYRDWFGKNTFAYRLLMLPTARISLYFSKATAILVLIFGLLAFQMILLPLENALFESLIPENFLETNMDVSSILQSNNILGIIIPPYFSNFLISYGIGMMFVFVLFTSILFERSFRLKGIVLGILYFIAAVLLYLSPLFIIDNESMPVLYPEEIFAIFLVLGIFIIGVSIIIGNWLISKRVLV